MSDKLHRLARMHGIASEYRDVWDTTHRVTDGTLRTLLSAMGIDAATETPDMKDKTLTCVDCGSSFLFTAGEQEFYLSKGFNNEPTRCLACRAARKRERSIPSIRLLLVLRGRLDIARHKSLLNPAPAA